MDPNEKNPSLVYSLDDCQIEAVIVRREDHPELKIAPEIMKGRKSNMPLRPLYFDTGTGMVKRAIPFSWTEGVSYVTTKKSSQSN